MLKKKIPQFIPYQIGSHSLSEAIAAVASRTSHMCKKRERKNPSQKD